MTFMILFLFGGIAIAVVVGLTLVLGTLTGRQRHDSAGPKVQRSAPTAMASGLAVVVFLFFALFFVRLRPMSVVDETDQLARAAPHELLSNAPPPSTNSPGTNLPEWTQLAELVVDDGTVGTAQFVASSQPCGTEEQARQEAVRLATAKLGERLSEAYPDLRDRMIPEDAFEKYSFMRAHTETWMEPFGAFEEPMFRVYVQFQDSPYVRQPIVQAWKRTEVDGRAVGYAVGLGLTALCLGTLSAFLRIFLAPAGKRRGPALATATLAGAIGVIATLV